MTKGKYKFFPNGTSSDAIAPGMQLKKNILLTKKSKEKFYILLFIL